MSISRRNLVIFYTSNLRGQIKPFSGTVQDQQYQQIGGLAFIKGFIADTANAFNFKRDEVLLLDTGDALFGTAEASLTKRCRAGAPGRTVDRKMFCGNSGIKSEERELFESLNLAACADKHHVYKHHDRHRQDNDDK